MFVRLRIAACVGILSLLLVACGGGSGSSSSGGGGQSIAGRWTAMFQIPGQTCVTTSGLTVKLSVNLDLALSQNGRNVSGTFRTTPTSVCGGNSAAATGTIKGTVTGTDVDLTDSDGAVYDLRTFNSNVHGLTMTGQIREGGIQVTALFQRP